MTAQIQLDMFRETTETDVVMTEVTAMKESNDKVRRKLFAQNGAMMKMILQQQEELDYIKMKMGLSCILEQK
jgi:hypothetical protein